MTTKKTGIDQQLIRDLAGILNDTNLTEIEEALAAPTPDVENLFAMMKGAGCGNCHKAYREELPDKTYRLRPGSI